jgi:uncharacterized surface protein with fasciclin (FAS1) repeats
MKKALIGLAAGTFAIGASIIPASAGYIGDTTIWDGITAGTCNDGGADIFEQVVLIGGWANALDTDGNGKPYYTVFAPYDSVLSAVLDDLNLEVSDLSSNTAVARSILNDHIANGSFDSNELEDTDLTRITMRSGFVVTVMGTNDPVSRAVPGDVYVGGAFISSASRLDNGWLYCINGFIDSEVQVPTNGVNSPTTVAPAATTPSALPDTL